MHTVPHDERLVTLGVDTHADIHVVVALSTTSVGGWARPRFPPLVPATNSCWSGPRSWG
jgi:hypothetical protein